MAKKQSGDLATTKGVTQILLVDDHALVRHGLVQLINQQPDLNVCGEAEDGASAMTAIEKLKPDFVVLDITLRSGSGLEVLKNIKTLFPKLFVMVLSMHNETIYGEMAFHAGAHGYLMKEAAIPLVITAIRKILKGELYASEAFSSQLLAQKLSNKKDVAPIKRLSDRELQVFQMIAQWKGNKQMAGELNLSVKTIEYYREQIKKKLGLKDSSQLVQHATTWVQRNTVA
jgi:DNA-binding NarL/FixJ family response regulator